MTRSDRPLPVRHPDSGERAILDGADRDGPRDPADRVAGTLSDDDDVRTDVAAHPASDTTARTGTSGSEETLDGLDATEEAVRAEAEDRAPGDGEPLDR